MKLFCQFFIFLIVLCLTQNIAYTQVEIVNVSDPILAAVIRNKLGLAPNASITIQQMHRLDSLTVYDHDIIRITGERNWIRDLTGLEHATELRRLILHATNWATDLSPLAGLTQLTNLELSFGKINNLSPLNGLTQLTNLDLVGNDISDLRPIAGLTQLKSLSIPFNPVSDFSPLTGLTKLTDLRVSVTSVELMNDLRNDVDLTKLKRLTIYGEGNQIGDINFFENLTQLEYLVLYGAQISDVSPLAGLINLQYLGLGDNQIVDVTPLAGLTNLRTLGLRDNQIIDITPLTPLTNRLTNRTTLWLEGNQIVEYPNFLVVESVQANHIKSYKEIQLYGPGPGVVIHDRYPGQDFEIHATVKNRGSRDSTATLLKYYLSDDKDISTDTKDDELLDASAIKPLHAGNSIKVSVRVTAPNKIGTYYYGVCLADSVGEGSCSVVQITVRENSPELVIESIKAEPAIVKPKEKFKITVYYKNVGTSTSAETAIKYYRSVNATFSETDELIKTGQRVSLAGKSRIGRELTLNAPENPGTYYYGACVMSIPNESIPDNNCSDIIQVTVTEPTFGSPGLKIPNGLISDVAFTPNYTFFVLHPQFISATDNSLDKYLLHRSTITLHLGGLYLDDTADYYTLPLPLKDNKTITEQVEDIGESAGKMLVQHMIGKMPLGENFKSGDLLKIGKIFFSFGDISDPKDDPKAELVYYANKHFGNTDGGDTYPILYVIKNKRLSNVGFEVEQIYHPPGSWIDIDLNFKAEESLSDNFFLSFLPDFIKNPLVFVGSIAVGASNLVMGTIGEVINGFNGLLVDINNLAQPPTTVKYEGVWNLEETFQMENPGMPAPSANLMSLADYPLFQQLPPEGQVYLFQLLEAHDFGKTMATNILRIPEETSLLANYPNPFNPETWIPYQLAKPADVNISIYGVDGTLVRKLD